jgi:tRNA modification GTPase
MLNALAGYDRAIVTPIPGTTRDTIEELVDVNGLPVRLIDTAGLRESTDEVERIGMNRARKAIETADLVFWISDGTRIDNQQIMEQEDLSEIVSCHQEHSLVLVIGKSDIPSLEPDRHRINLQDAFPNAPILSFSAITLDGLEDIRTLIRAKYEESGAQGSEEVLITNARHYHALLQARQALLLVSKDSTSTHRIPWDLLATVLRSAADSLALITGDTVSEELVDEIFSRFCIGK